MKYHENIMVFNSKVYNPIMIPVDGRKAKKGVNKGASVFNKGLERSDYLDKVYTDKYPSSILEISNADQTNRLHPTQKPVALCEYLIKTYTSPGDLVLDNCMGSFTTAVAAKNSARNFIGFENNKEYFDKGSKRIGQINL